MKKVWTLIACFAACLSLAACGTDSNSSTPGSTVATTTTAKTEAADKTEKTTAATTAATKEQGSAAGMTLEAVSYTHLDVYKRQVYGGVAQLGERTVRIRKVESSILFVSTNKNPPWFCHDGFLLCYFSLLFCKTNRNLR